MAYGVTWEGADVRYRGVLVEGAEPRLAEGGSAGQVEGDLAGDDRKCLQRRWHGHWRLQKL